MIQMHRKSFKRSRRRMKYWEMKTKELSLILMELLGNSLVEWVEVREDSEVILTQRNCSEQYLGTRAHLLEILATLVKVVVGARQSNLTLVPRSIMSTLPSSKQHRGCRRTCTWASWTPVTSVKVSSTRISDVSSDLSVQGLGVSQDQSQRDVQHVMELVWRQCLQDPSWWGPPAGRCACPSECLITLCCYQEVLWQGELQ